MIPGMIILLCIFSLCFLWAGLRPSGFAIIHVMTMLSLTVSLYQKPPVISRPRYLRLWISFALLCIIQTLNYLLWGCSTLGFDVIVLWLDLGVAAWIVIRMSKRDIRKLMAFWFAGRPGSSNAIGVYRFELKNLISIFRLLVCRYEGRACHQIVI